jgi:RND family efflux transporter MFP subunit
MNRSVRVALLTAALFTLAACGGKPPAQKAAGTPPPLATLKVHMAEMPWQQVWDGTVQAVHSAALTAQTDARVLELPHDVNDFVPAGAVEQKSAKHAAQAQIASARAAYVNAQSNYKRITGIFNKGLVSKATFDDARAQRDAAQAALKAAQANWRQAGQAEDYTVVRAPYAGVITKRYVEVGEAVTGPPFAQKLIGIASLKDLRVDVSVPQNVVGAIRKYEQAWVVTDGGGKRIAASKITVFPYADPQTHTFTVRIGLPSGDVGLRPGEVVQVAFMTGSKPRLLIPESALVRRGELIGVYVIHDGTVSLRLVRLGHRFGDKVEVISGLESGEVIASDPLRAVAWLTGQHEAHPRQAGKGKGG